jgi:hypothetical protein
VFDRSTVWGLRRCRGCSGLCGLCDGSHLAALIASNTAVWLQPKRADRLCFGAREGGRAVGQDDGAVTTAAAQLNHLLARVVWRRSVAPSAFSGELLFKIDRHCDLHRVRRKVMALSATASVPAAATAGVSRCPAF